jgi:folate-binding protein YgfZ
MNPVDDKPCFVTLPQRGLVRVSGPEASKFLQNLVTNDLGRLTNTSTIHACLLSPQGKFLHDFYITKDSETYLLNCEGTTRTEDLLRRLGFYQLRSKVTIDHTPQIRTFLSLPDWQVSYTGFQFLPEVSFEHWDQFRIRHARPDGNRDAEIGLSTLAELNLDTTTTVSYTKGCYIGQELVAKMHNRNLGKKHLVALEFDSPQPAWGEEIKMEGLSLGYMRSSCQKTGLALLTFETEDFLKQRREENKDDPIRLLG